MPVVSVSFVDTNVLLYAVSNAAEEREKSRIARELLHGQVALSFQVLQEFYASATHPQKLGLHGVGKPIHAGSRGDLNLG